MLPAANAVAGPWARGGRRRRGSAPAGREPGVAGRGRSGTRAAGTRATTRRGQAAQVDVETSHQRPTVGHVTTGTASVATSPGTRRCGVRVAPLRERHTSHPPSARNLPPVPLITAGREVEHPLAAAGRTCVHAGARGRRGDERCATRYSSRRASWRRNRTDGQQVEVRRTRQALRSSRGRCRTRSAPCGTPCSGTAAPRCPRRRRRGAAGSCRAFRRCRAVGACRRPRAAGRSGTGATRRCGATGIGGRRSPRS